MKVLIIIPAYNEEKNIATVINSLYCENPNWDIIVVDDGSTDKTYSIAKGTKKAIVLSLSFNLGIGGAVQTGFKYALINDYDFALQCDGDGQHRPQEITKLLSITSDVVIGSRFLKKNKGFGSTFFRRIGIIFFQFLIRILTGKNITDATSGFRLYGRKAIKLLSSYYPDDYPEPEAIVYLLKNGLEVREIPVIMDSRISGKSSINFFDSIYYMVKVAVSILLTKMRK